MDAQLLRIVRGFTQALLNPADPSELLHRLTEDTTSALGADGAGIMLADEDGKLRFAAASEERVVKVELVQIEITDGACHEAFARGEVVVVDDLTTIDRWPGYVKRALDVGLRAVVGVPMIAYGRSIGALNVYRNEATSWTAAEVARAEILAAIGAGHVLHAGTIRSTSEVESQLRQAIASRDVIGQAKGMLMARHHVDADTAFELLRRASQHRNERLTSVARRLVEGELDV